MFDQIKQEKIVCAYDPGGHSNMGPQEIFFRARGLMHISTILDEGTSLNGGALRNAFLLNSQVSETIGHRRASGYQRERVELDKGKLFTASPASPAYP